MMRRFIIFFSSIIYITLQATDSKQWTFFVYMAGDNSLYNYTHLDVEEMKKIGSNADINVLVSLHTRFPDQEKVSKRLLIHKGSAEQIGPDMQLDSGSEATFTSELQWAVENFPSEHLAVVVWDHGSGSYNRAPARAVCYDDSTGHFLTDANYQRAFNSICKQYLGGKKIDIVAFDACLMADVEVAAAIKPFVRLMVSSQQTIPGEGFQYAQLLAPFEKSVLNPEQFARHMVRAYNTTYASLTNDYTLSAINLDKLDPVINNINTIAQILEIQLKRPTFAFVKQTIKLSSSPLYCTHFDDSAFIDLVDFYKNILIQLPAMRMTYNEIAQLKAYLLNGIRLIRQAVIMKAQGTKFPRASGLSIYLPQATIDSTYLTTYWAKNSKWISFLRNYLK